MKFPTLLSKLLLFCCLLLTSTHALPQTAPAAANSPTELAAKIAQHMQKGELDKVHALFSAEMSQKLTKENFEATWKGVQQQVGQLKAISAPELQPPTISAAGIHQLVVPMTFEKAALDLKLGINAQNQLVGLFIAPAKPRERYADPDYAKADEYTERQVTITSGEYSLPGILTLPKGKSKVPVVVLVHGSGPQDRDLSVGPNKIFRDLALGLATQGVATLRYDKRTLVYGIQMASQISTLTVQEEVIDDAVAAIKFAAKQPETDPKKVFVLGHSLGAYLAPGIAQAAPELNGLVLVSAPARPLEDMIMEQLTYLSENGGSKGSQQGMLSQMRQQVANVKSMTLSAQTPADSLPLGLPAAYWLDLRGYNPVYIARSLPQRLMILHGERDYQVTRQDFELWQQGLKGRGRQFTPVLYSELNHLLQVGKGKSLPAEYEKHSHVPLYLVKNIASWVKTGI